MKVVQKSIRQTDFAKQVLHMVMGLERLDRIVRFTEEAGASRPSPFQQASVQNGPVPSSRASNLPSPGSAASISKVSTFATTNYSRLETCFWKGN